MLSQQDEIAISYRKSCSDLREKLKIELHHSNRDEFEGEFFCKNKDIFNPLVVFEEKLFHYVRIKQDFQAENKTLQMKIRELQLGLNAKNKCIMNLKNDIAQHYAQIELLKKQNQKLENQLKDTEMKLSQCEELRKWLNIHSISIQDNAENEEASNNDVHYNDSRIKIIPSDLCLFEKKSETHHSNNDECEKIHMKLLKIWKGNKIPKQVLEKQINIKVETDKFNEIIESGYNTVTKLNIAKHKGHENIAQIRQLNTIIDCMKLTILQLQFEKRNMELSIFRMSEYFMRIRDIHAQQKVHERHGNPNLDLVDTKRKILPIVLREKYSQKDNPGFPDLFTRIRSLKSEKLQMETEHHDELSCLSEKFGKIQFILNDIKAICDSDSENIKHKSFSNTDLEFVDTTHLSPKRTIAISTRHASSYNVDDSARNDIPSKRRQLSQYILRRVKLMEEQYKRILLLCSKNIELLKKLDERSLISQLRKMKILVLVKEKESIDQIKRFEKYKRFLVRSIKEYRLSFKEKEKQNLALQMVCFDVVTELRGLKNCIPENKKNLQNSTPINYNSQSDEVLKRIDNLTNRINDIVHRSDSHHVETQKDFSTYCSEEGIADQLKLRSSTLLKRDCTRDLTEKTERSLGLNDSYVILMREEIDKSHYLIAKLNKEKSNLQADLKQREYLLGKIFNCFKRKIEGIALEINDKYFLQRLCKDLRSAIKIYGGQNRVMKEALENNNICTKTAYTQMTIRKNSISFNKEEYIRELLRQQSDSFEIQEQFSDIQSHLESMKKDVSLLQKVINKK